MFSVPSQALRVKNDQMSMMLRQTVYRKVNYFLGRLPIYLLRRIVLGLSIILIGILIFLSYSPSRIKFLQNDHLKYGYSFKNPKYLINTTNCRIPDIDPLNEDILPFVKLEKYEECTNKPLLTYIEKLNDVVKLKINQSVIHLYSSLSISCCYSKILRKGDETVYHSQCRHFHDETEVDYGLIRVICSSIFGIIYQNVHATFMLPSNQLENNSNSTKPHKVFLLGIDSISRLNLQRTMPQTFRYLENNFVSFRGYNKIADNTFPNLIAILTGRSSKTLGDNCRINQTFDNCDIIWKTFRENGFVTAYGEDEPDLSTFSYYKQGFIKPPTDYYIRPYFISAYRLPLKMRDAMTICSGPENTAARMLNAAKDFEMTVKYVPSFSLFWMNSFSHENVNMPSSMDENILDFLTDSDLVDSLRNSIVVVFSDHGFRFGEVRFTYTGWMEERLPFIYFKFPGHFQKNYPDMYKNFIFNARERLVTPYDFHLTLKHVLNLFNDSFSIELATGCPKAQTLFEQIPETRSCDDACIPTHWCTCKGYNYISTKEAVVSSVARFVVRQINKIIQSYEQEATLCAEFRLKRTVSVGKAKKTGNIRHNNLFLIIIETYPYAMFEATVEENSQNRSFELMGDISRLNLYRDVTFCITQNGGLKKYCFCDGWFNKVKSGLCYYLGC